MSITLLALALSQPLHASALAPELGPRTGPPPADAALPDGGLDPDEREALLDETDAELATFARLTTSALRGEVLTSRSEFVDGVRLEVLTMLVSETLRGPRRPGDVLELRVPLRGAMSGELSDTYRSVQGYEILIFVDDSGYMVHEDAMYVMEGGFGFRARDPDHLLRPRMDHDWVRSIDPVEDYSVVTIHQVREVLEEIRAGERESRRRRRSRRD
jgi:hypothetical protein